MIRNNIFFHIVKKVVCYIVKKDTAQFTGKDEMTSSQELNSPFHYGEFEIVSFRQFIVVKILSTFHNQFKNKGTLQHETMAIL